MLGHAHKKSRRNLNAKAPSRTSHPIFFELLEPRLMMTAWVQLILTYAGSTQQRVTRGAGAFVLAGGPDGPNPNLTQLDLNSATAQDPSWIHYFDISFQFHGDPGTDQALWSLGFDLHASNGIEFVTPGGVTNLVTPKYFGFDYLCDINSNYINNDIGGSAGDLQSICLLQNSGFDVSRGGDVVKFGRFGVEFAGPLHADSLITATDAGVGDFGYMIGNDPKNMHNFFNPKSMDGEAPASFAITASDPTPVPPPVSAPIVPPPAQTPVDPPTPAPITPPPAPVTPPAPPVSQTSPDPVVTTPVAPPPVVVPPVTDPPLQTTPVTPPTDPVTPPVTQAPADPVAENPTVPPVDNPAPPADGTNT